MLTPARHCRVIGRVDAGAAMPIPLLAAVVLGLASTTFAQNYRVERIASGLNQPTFVTQAPGDAGNILYFTERTQNANPGFSVANNMGKVYRYDVTTRTKDLVLDLSARPVRDDAGLQTIAFHPDFQTNGKLYVSSAEDTTGVPPTSRVEEYIVSNTGTAAGYSAALSRTILQYNGVALSGNHTVNWIGFDPTATGAARNYLHISTGDGNAGGASRPSQNPSDIRGKMLRVDISGGDSYLGDDNKNFLIPPTNPLPVYNQTHAPIAGLGEVYMTGLRNVYRASFDRATGDLYFGDVGEQTREEINFVKAGSNAAGPPADFGWPQREGTINGWTSPYSMTNPYTGVTSLNPIQEMAHPAALAFIGGYRYRGPIESLADKYFFADFATDKLYMLENFDPDTDPATFNGANGSRTDITALWNSLVMDPTDPTYAGTNTNTNLFGIDHIVSLGEDNLGNLYIVDFGFGTGFSGQYPGPGLGEIFRVTLIPEPVAAALVAPLALVMLRRRPRASSKH